MLPKSFQFFYSLKAEVSEFAINFSILKANFIYFIKFIKSFRPYQENEILPQNFTITSCFSLCLLITLYLLWGNENLISSHIVLHCFK